MHTKKWARRLSSAWPLLALYGVCVLARYLLATATSSFPTVNIDEFLYYSLGRSIATEGTLRYHGQPALYNYIVYPLVLSPVYLFFRPGVNYYRIIQLWNILLMSLSVFPLNRLCLAMFREKKKAFWLTALFMLLPDFFLGQYVFSEAIIYPLFYTLMCCVYQYLKNPKIKYAVWVGILGAVLYNTKPGSVIPAAAALLLFIGRAAVRKSPKEARSALLGVVGLAAVFGLFQLLTRTWLAYDGAFFSVYDDQMYNYSGLRYDYFFRNAALYPFYFLLACAVLPFLVSLWRSWSYSREDKCFYWLSILCAFGTMLGTAWMINRPEGSEILYLRYVDMYLPVVFSFSILPYEPQAALPSRRKKVLSSLCLLLLCYGAVCPMIWGSTAGIGKSYDVHFLASLSSLFLKNVMGVANILILLVCAFSLFALIRFENKKSLSVLCCAFFALSLLVNNVSAYAISGQNTAPKRARESFEIQQSIQWQDYLFVHDPLACDYGLDVNTDRNIAYVQPKDFYWEIHNQQGVYVPFVPSSERGADAQLPTPDVDRMIIDKEIADLIRFSDGVSAVYSSMGNYCMVQFERGARLVDGMLSNLKGYTLPPGEKSNLTLYNEDWLSKPLMLRMEIESEAEQPLSVVSALIDDAFTVAEGRYWYEIKIPELEAGYNFIVENAPVQIYDYELIPMEPAD